jgi:hypothetical protein
MVSYFFQFIQKLLLHRDWYYATNNLIASLNNCSILHLSVILTAAKILILKDFYAVIRIMLTKQ